MSIKFNFFFFWGWEGTLTLNHSGRLIHLLLHVNTFSILLFLATYVEYVFLFIYAEKHFGY